MVRPSWSIIEVLPCISRSADTMRPPKCCTRDWCPRHTPSTGTRPSKAASICERDARVVGAARAGRDAQVGRLQGKRLRDSQLVVPVHQHLGAQHQERLHQVVGEGVVVVDQQQFRLPHGALQRRSQAFLRDGEGVAQDRALRQHLVVFTLGHAVGHDARRRPGTGRYRPGRSACGWRWPGPCRRCCRSSRRCRHTGRGAPAPVRR